MVLPNSESAARTAMSCALPSGFGKGNRALLALEFASTVTMLAIAANAKADAMLRACRRMTWCFVTAIAITRCSHGRSEATAGYRLNSVGRNGGVYLRRPARDAAVQVVDVVEALHAQQRHDAGAAGAGMTEDDDVARTVDFARAFCDFVGGDIRRMRQRGAFDLVVAAHVEQFERIAS